MTRDHQEDALIRRQRKAMDLRRRALKASPKEARKLLKEAEKLDRQQ